jgi:hypothetical protein
MDSKYLFRIICIHISKQQVTPHKYVQVSCFMHFMYALKINLKYKILGIFKKTKMCFKKSNHYEYLYFCKKMFSKSQIIDLFTFETKTIFVISEFSLFSNSKRVFVCR